MVYVGKNVATMFFPQLLPGVVYKYAILYRHTGVSFFLVIQLYTKSRYRSI